MMIKIDIEQQILLETQELSPELSDESVAVLQVPEWIPQHAVGEVKSSLRREEIYSDAR